MERITGSNSPSNEVSPDTLKVDGDTQISKVQQKIISMWAYQVNQEMWANPVLLSNFFGEYAAYVGFYASMVNQLFLGTRDAVEHKTNEIYKEFGDKSATFIDSLVRRTERQVTKQYEYYDKELKTFNNNINSMQTQLRLYGDEAKTNAGGV